jgi:hypothetical protein
MGVKPTERATDTPSSTFRFDFTLDGKILVGDLGSIHKWQNQFHKRHIKRYRR